MLPIALPDRRFMQLCWVVPDLDVAMASWTKTTGVGPFFRAHVTSYDNPMYRGKPTIPPPFEAALAQAGDIQIELVCQKDDTPSVFRDVVPLGQSGFHHTCLYSDSYDRDVGFYEKAGFKVIFSGLMMGYRVCWIDTTPALGFMVEILTKNPTADAVFETIRSGGHNWDGRDPVRRLG